MKKVLSWALVFMMMVVVSVVAVMATDTVSDPAPWNGKISIAATSTSISGGEIDLNAETITVDGNYAGYSFDGKKWVSGELSSDNFKAQLNKGIPKLSFATELDAKGKKASGTSIAFFPAIEKRPKGNIQKYSVFYSDTAWSFGANKKAKEPVNTTLLSSFEWIPSTIEKSQKTPEGVFVSFNDSIDNTERIIKEPDSNGKVQKSVYFFRNAATHKNRKYYPASNPFKINVSSKLKPLKLKANYKTEKIKVPKGSYVNETQVTDAKGVVSISDMMGQTITAYKSGTGAKPATAVASLTLAARTPTATGTLTSDDKGKFTKEQIGNLEFRAVNSAANAKWGKFPKTGTAFEVRLKSTARVKKNETEGTAASEIFDVDVMRPAVGAESKAVTLTFRARNTVITDPELALLTAVAMHIGDTVTLLISEMTFEFLNDNGKEDAVLNAVVAKINTVPGGTGNYVINGAIRSYNWNTPNITLHLFVGNDETKYVELIVTSFNYTN